MNQYRFFAVLTLLLFATGLAAPFPAQAAPVLQTIPLFTDAPSPGGDLGAAALDDPAALRIRFVTVNLAALESYLTPTDLAAQSEAPLTIQLFTDTQISAIVTRREASITGGVTLSGQITGDEPGFLSFSIQGSTLSASIWIGSSFYDISYLQDGVHLIRQVDSANLPGDSPDMLPPVPTVSDLTAQYGGDDTGGEIDVLVIYTTTAKNAAGGQSSILSKINQAVSDANTSYQNSQINQRMVLVGTQETTYSEVGISWNTTLNALTSTTDGVMDDVHTLRSSTAADLVVMIVNRVSMAETGYCGMGWLLNDPAATWFDAYGFSLVSQDCLTSLTFAHETGHNMGAHHDRANASGQGAYSYAYGYQGFSSGTCKFYTVMAYFNGCSGGSRIPYFSNPGVSYLGIPTGVDQSSASSADNHLTLNNTAALIAKFRDGAPPPAPSSLTVTASDQPSLVLDWTDNSTTETGFIIERYTGSTWGEIARVGSNVTTYTNTGLTCQTTYTYRVRSYSPNGTSSTSNEVAKAACTVTAPTNLSASAAAYNPSSPSQRIINLSWQDTNTGETGYSIERSISGANNYSVITTTAADATSYADSTASCATAYDYRARAVKSGSYSSYSNVASATSLICAPLQPTGLSATKASQVRINLSWTDPSNSASNNETSFRIERKIGAGAWTFVANVGSGVTTYSDTGLTCGTTYSYQVRGSNAGGDSAWSASASDTTFACDSPPPIPTGVTAWAYSVNGLQITWNNVDSESGYRVERSPNGSTSWTEIAVIGADVLFYNDKLLTWNTRYYYRVRAYNSYGASSYSSTVNAKTFQNGIFIPIPPGEFGMAAGM